MPCGKVRKSFDAPVAGRRKPMEKELWHECPQGSIFDGDIPRCPACRTENLKELYLTVKEVVQRVWPDWLKIWTRQPSRFNEPLAEVRREMAEASVQEEQRRQAVPV